MPNVMNGMVKSTAVRRSSDTVNGAAAKSAICNNHRHRHVMHLNGIGVKNKRSKRRKRQKRLRKKTNSKKKKCYLSNIGKISCITAVHTVGVSLPVLEHTHDLGVIVSSDLLSSVHITDIVAKASKRAWPILRAFSSEFYNIKAL